MNLQKGLVGHWTMNSTDVDNGVIRDRSGHENHGQINGAEDAYPGISTESFSFNGTDDYLNFGNDNSIRNKTMSFGVWVYPRDSNSELFSFRLNGGPYQIYEISQGSVVYSFEDGSTKQLNFSISQEEWTHVFSTYNNTTNEIKVYKNGSQVNSGTSNNVSLALNGAGASVSNLYAGCSRPGLRHADAMIDDARVYNRVLSQAEIEQLYNIRSDRSYGSPYVPRKPVAASNLVAWYPFEGEASDATAFQPWAADDTDYSGTVNGATYQESGGVTDIRRGSNTAAYEFDTTGNIELFNHGLSSHSISCWLNTDVLGYNTGGSNALIFGYYDGGGAKYTIINMDGDSLNYRIDDGSNSYTKVAGSSINTVEWNHAVLTYNSSTSNVKAYLDGSLLGEISYSSGIVFDTGNYYIGGNPVNGTNFDGKVDDCRIYNRALTESEVSSIYNNTKP